MFQRCGEHISFERSLIDIDEYTNCCLRQCRVILKVVRFREQFIATKMSNKVDDHPSKLDGVGNKRKRSRNNYQQTDNSTSYNGISFNKRSSSLRPGSPHRYFDSSYDILMEDTTSMLESEVTSNKQSHGLGNQVVHRHLNGLCIITAGNVIQQQLGSASNGDNKEEGIQIKDIKYHIQPSKDSQSARGKMRTKKKKRKKQKHQNEQANHHNATVEDGIADGVDSSKIEVANHDGYVLPQDKLCTVTLSNGQEIQLKCCVEGTVIEINNRLVDGSNNSSDTVASDSLIAEGDVSLLMKEPLLDGYLAVIMPSRGVFPPR